MPDLHATSPTCSRGPAWAIKLLALLMIMSIGSMAHAESAVEAMVAADEGEQPEAEQMSGNRVGWIELNAELREAPLPFAWVIEEEAGDSLQALLKQIKLVRDDAEYRGLVVFIDQPPLTLTQCTAIADALREVKETGKTVMTFAEVYDLRAYLIASAADMVLLQKKGAVELSGIAVEEMYIAGMFEKIGVKPDLLQVGKYKGADETWMNAKPSEAWDENFDSLLDGLYAQSLQRIMDGPGHEPGRRRSAHGQVMGDDRRRAAESQRGGSTGGPRPAGGHRGQLRRRF